MAAKQPDKSKDYITNKVLVVFSVCLLGVLALMFLNNILANTTHVMAGLRVLSAGKYVGLVIALIGAALIFRERKKNIDVSYKLLRGRTLVIFGIVLFVMFLLLYRYADSAFKACYILLPAFAFYYLVFHSYQPEFVVIATDCGVGAILAYLAGTNAFGSFAYALLAVAVVLAVAQLVLVLRVKGAAGKLALGGKEYAFKFSKNAYLMMQLGAVALAVIVAAGVFAGSTLLALGIAAALFIVTGVYYTVKLV